MDDWLYHLDVLERHFDSDQAVAASLSDDNERAVDDGSLSPFHDDLLTMAMPQNDDFGSFISKLADESDAKNDGGDNVQLSYRPESLGPHMSPAVESSPEDELDQALQENNLRAFDEAEGGFGFQNLEEDNVLVGDFAAATTAHDGASTGQETDNDDFEELLNKILPLDDGDEIDITKLLEYKPSASSATGRSQAIPTCVTFDTSPKPTKKRTVTPAKYCALDQIDSKISSILVPKASAPNVSSSKVRFGQTAAEGCYDVAYVNSLRSSPAPMDLPSYTSQANTMVNDFIANNDKLEYAKEMVAGPTTGSFVKLTPVRACPATPKAKLVEKRMMTPTSRDSSESSTPRSSPCQSLKKAVEETRHRSWTDEEDDMLRKSFKSAAMKRGPNSKAADWDAVAKVFMQLGGNRSGSQCKTRWPNLVNKQGDWLKWEDTFIKEKVDELGMGKWAAIAAELPGRESNKVRDRWVNHLDPRIIRSPFTEEETTFLFQCQSDPRLHKKWATIQKKFKEHLNIHRTPNQLKNRYNNHSKALENKRAREEAAVVLDSVPYRPTKRARQSETSQVVAKEEDTHDFFVGNSSDSVPSVAVNGPYLLANVGESASV